MTCELSNKMIKCFQENSVIYFDLYMLIYLPNIKNKKPIIQLNCKKRF